MLNKLKARLLLIEPGAFQHAAYLNAQLPDQIVVLMLEKGEVIRPREVRHVVGEPSSCHDNSLKYFAQQMERGIECHPFLGFYRLNDKVWRLHSWVMEGNGVLVESAPPFQDKPAIYFGMPWTIEVFMLLAPLDTAAGLALKSAFEPAVG